MTRRRRRSRRDAARRRARWRAKADDAVIRGAEIADFPPVDIRAGHLRTFERLASKKSRAYAEAIEGLRRLSDFGPFGPRL